MKILHQLFNFLVSKGLTLILMGSGAITMAIITVFEAMEGGEEVPFRYYYSPWFVTLLLLVWLNLAGNMLQPRWWRLKRLALSLSHLGFLLILTGGLFTWVLGVRGNLFIEEGESLHSFQVDHPVLTIRGNDDDPNRETAFLIDGDLRIRPHSWLELLNPFSPKNECALSEGETVYLLDTLASSRVRAEVKQAPAGEGPAALVLERENGNRGQLVLQDRETLSLDDYNGINLVYRHLSEGESPDDLLDQFDEYISIKPAQGDELKIPIHTPEDVGRTFEQGDYTVTLLEYHPDFKMGSPPDPSAPVRNPALRLQVTGPAGEQKLYCFAWFEFHGNRMADGTEVGYQRPFGNRQVLLVSKGEESVEAYTGADPAPTVLTRDTPLVFETGAGTLGLRFVDQWPGSRKENLIVHDPTGMGPPAFLVRIGEHGAPAWLCRDRGEARSRDGRISAGVGNKLPLGFTVTLDDAVAEFWPLSNIPRAFFSLVRIAAPDLDGPQPDRVETNEPLYRNGYRLYQSNMDMKAPFRWSVFSVSKDPGVPLVTIGFLMMMAGLCWLYWTRFVLGPLRKKKEPS
ncbi:MAG: cytochrome c biogenesis protein ResB [Planctomycetes bacterium]|nr:cytochrome c biogenesis protein ResB [Planctomycetota bacterium]